MPPDTTSSSKSSVIPSRGANTNAAPADTSPRVGNTGLTESQIEQLVGLVLRRMEREARLERSRRGR